MKIDSRDALGGAVLALIGAYFLYHSFGYGIGTARRMGAGYFPMLMGGATVFLGIVIVIRGIGRRVALAKVDWRPAIAILSSIAIFGLAIRSLGLVPTVALTAVVAALGDSDVQPLPTAILVISITFGVWLVFSFGLRLPLPAF